MFSFTQLKIDFFPDIKFPYAGIITSYTGVGPEDIENLITRPIEEAVSAVKNIEEVSSQSVQGASIVTLEFKYGTDMDQADVDIRKNIDFIRDYLPEDATEPITFIFDPSMQPIMFITLSSPYLGPAELRKLSEETIEPLLERVDGVASVETQGGLERQINVNINPVLLSSYGLSPTDVNRAIQTGGGIQPGGTLKTKVKNYNLRILSEYIEVEQIKNTTLTVKNGTPVYIKDVAEVVDGYKESTNEVRSDYSEGITILVSKQSDANTVLACRKVKEAFPYISERLPEGTKFSILYDQSEFIMKSINNLESSAFIAFILAFIVIYIFLLNWRGSIIIGVAIPIAIIATFAVLYALDLTLNIISMAGLALAVGMLVDNSIVVLENIYRHRELGETRMGAADKGATEVGMAITASTLTTVAVFVPVLFVPNITGQLFKDMVLTISFSLIVSLIVSLTIVPMLSANILKIVKKDHSEEGKNKFLNKFKAKTEYYLQALTDKYEKLLKWTLFHKKTVLGAVFVMLLLSVGSAFLLEGEFMPKTDRGFINVVIDSPAGSPVEDSRLYVYRIENMVKEIIEDKDLESIAVFFGEREGFASFGSTASTIELFIKLKPVEERSQNQFEIQDKLREKLDDVAGISYIFQEGGSLSSEKDIEVKVIGFDTEGAKKIADQIKRKMEKIKGLVDVSLNMKETTPELQVHLNKDIMNKLGLSSMQVASNISTAIQGQVVSQFRDAEDEYDIRVQYAKEFRNKKDALSQMQIALPAGKMIKLEDIAEISEESSSPTIYRENQQRFVSIGCSLSDLDLSAATAKINEIIEDTPVPSEYQIILGGTAADQEEAFFYLALAFLAAVLLVYMIMASQFESLVDPLIIMFTVPLSIIGVFLFLLITGTSINVMSLVGIVMLVGIAVNNGIVLVDYINQLRAEGLELYKAVEQGSIARLRPVLMTALTTVLGMVPLAIELGSGSETWSPLARSVIGGLLTTTVLTLVVIPILYILFERMEEILKEKYRKVFKKA